jgi:hypothetical protein
MVVARSQQVSVGRRQAQHGAVLQAPHVHHALLRRADLELLDALRIGATRRIAQRHHAHGGFGWTQPEHVEVDDLARRKQRASQRKQARQQLVDRVGVGLLVARHAHVPAFVAPRELEPPGARA